MIQINRVRYLDFLNGEWCDLSASHFRLGVSRPHKQGDVSLLNMVMGATLCPIVLWGRALAQEIRDLNSRPSSVPIFRSVLTGRLWTKGWVYPFPPHWRWLPISQEWKSNQWYQKESKRYFAVYQVILVFSWAGEVLDSDSCFQGYFCC